MMKFRTFSGALINIFMTLPFSRNLASTHRRWWDHNWFSLKVNLPFVRDASWQGGGGWRGARVEGFQKRNDIDSPLLWLNVIFPKCFHVREVFCLTR